ncbi:hypothetical protein KFL_003510070 [Klebsormidium nitens]|uniref:Kazal-like domain-containing protein n=1 Tax=Klebsormidium nitens TaxID=105231 RepID=A0A1Y1IA19_KLENI|nr:hypothetical protein KFL_003510070 [Klebsormidium nitens]|eukprot:GAQ87413.1 hypothetical protein KFL_003510070 [Klebsormidium nitens]
MHFDNEKSAFVSFFLHIRCHVSFHDYQKTQSSRPPDLRGLVCTTTPLVRCFADPCQVNKCPAFPAATCQANYCGGCNADWFVKGHKVDCNASSPTTPPTCRQGGNIKPIDCPAGYTCHLTPVTTPLSNPDAGRRGVCLPTAQGPARAPAPAPAPATPAGCGCDNSTYQVCGQDGVTYQNACMAKCKGASYFPGPCGSCNCPTDWVPVCGSDNKTYINTCDAQCHGISGPYKKGECGAQTSSCGCSNDQNPVCGSDGKTYKNACLAKCAKKSYFPGACGQCICIAVYSPVCSSTGALYGNECEARCHGASPPFTKPGTGGTCLNAPSSGLEAIVSSRQAICCA